MPTCRSSLAALLAIWQFLDRTRWNTSLSLKISLVSIMLRELGERTFEENETHGAIPTTSEVGMVKHIVE